jgi:hypothetical protein
MKHLILTTLLLTTLLTLSGCGGGGDSSNVNNTPAGTTFSTGKYASLAAGDGYTVTVTGSDTAGGSYTGSSQVTVVGATTFEGHSVIQKNSATTLTKTGVGVLLNSTSQAYYNPDRTLYKIVFSNGVVATASNTFPLPTTIQIGSFGGQSLSYSNGNTLSQTWQIIDAGNSTATAQITATNNYGISEVDSITVDTAGTILGMTQVIYNFPTSGVTTTLHGTVH